MTIVVNGKQKRVRRPPRIDGIDANEFILQNADPVWLHQNQMWEFIEETTNAHQIAPADRATTHAAEQIALGIAREIIMKAVTVSLLSCLALMFCATRGEAKAIVAADPAVKAGIFLHEVHPWGLVQWEKLVEK